MKTLFLLLMAILLAACSTTTITSRQLAIDHFNSQADNRTGLIDMTSNSSYLGKDIYVSRGEIFWTTVPLDEPRHVSISEVKRVVFVKRAKGAVYGAAVGFVSGVAGLGLAFLASGGPSSSGWPISKNGAYAMFLLPVAAAGAGTGAISGSIIGFDEVYEFQQK
jgi:hypothetical protein